jgi:hypothetical protein
LSGVRNVADQRFEQWRREHNERRHNLPIRGRLYGALIVLSNLEDGVWLFSELDQAASTDSEKFFSLRSIKNHTNSRVSSTLTRHHQAHLMPTASKGELGRTSTGTKIAGLQFIWLIREALEQAPLAERDEQGNALTTYLYEQIFSLLQLYQDLGGLDLAFSASESVTAYISRLLDAHQSNPGAVLQHLVGAKLERRFVDRPLAIEHHSSATADIQTGRRGDFEIGTTVFHVTKRATDDHYRKARQNAQSGRKVYLLVPDSVLRATKDLADNLSPGFCREVDVFSIEQFVAQNLDEMAIFDKSEALRQLILLLDKYNELIDAYENDRSLKIIIPDFGVE